jgi:hypothetical protein
LREARELPDSSPDAGAEEIAVAVTRQFVVGRLRVAHQHAAAVPDDRQIRVGELVESARGSPGQRDVGRSPCNTDIETSCGFLRTTRVVRGWRHLDRVGELVEVAADQRQPLQDVVRHGDDMAPMASA